MTPLLSLIAVILFFFNDPATTEIYTLSLHDALPIYSQPVEEVCVRKSSKRDTVRHKSYAAQGDAVHQRRHSCGHSLDRKSTRLNSSHSQISYAVFCLKKKKKKKIK